MNKDYRVEALKNVIKILDKLKSEGQRWVLRSAFDFFKLNEAAFSTPVVLDEANGVETALTRRANLSVKDFMKAKRPQSDLERVACLAFYLTHMRKMPHFKTHDVEKLNVEAAGAAFSDLPKAMGNALHLRGFLARVGGGKRQLTTYGEDIVNALPDREKVKLVSSQMPKKRSHRKRKPKRP
jgi:hypothetical protein